MFRLSSAAIVLALAIVPVTAFAAGEGGPTAAAAPAPASLPAISVTPVIETTLRDRVIATGTFQPAEIVLVQPQIEGQAIEELLAEVGDKVEAGQVLARLSDSALTLQRSQLVASHAAAEAAVAQARAQVAEAEASHAETERNLERTRTLRAQGTASQAALDNAQAQATTSEARVNAAKQGLAAAEAQIGLIDAQIADVDLNIGRTQIAAPVGGVITERNARIGAIASAGGGTAMFTLIRDGALEMYADVPEQDLLRLDEGQPVTLRVIGRAEPISGVVRLVEPSVDAATRLGRVRIAVDDPTQVRDGMFAEAEILVAERTALAAPVSAVGADATALRVENGVVQRVPVTTGIRDGGLVELREGLALGDTIVVRAGAFVRDGDRINPVPADAPVASN